MAKQKEPLHPILEKLLPDGDERLLKFCSVNLLASFLFVGWASTAEVVMDDNLVAKKDKKELTATMKLEDEKKEEKKPKKEEKKEVRKKQGGGGKPRGKGDPNATPSRGVLKILATKTSTSGFSAYNLGNAKFQKDLNKVLDQVAGLQTTGDTKLGGRKGSAKGGFNEGYAEGGSGGIGDMLGGLLGGGGGSISTEAKGKIKAPSAKEIDMGDGDGSRSKESIMRVVRSKQGGLRFAYNKYLKTTPGMAGVVTVKFTITPQGDVVSASIIKSTTGNGEFDAEILEKVKTWKWEVIKGGNTPVTIPLTFSE